jgi:hypothetical protein
MNRPALGSPDLLIGLLMLGLLMIRPDVAQAQGQIAQRHGGKTEGPATLGLEQGVLSFDTPDFRLKLVKTSQTVAALQPQGAEGFDFTPADRLAARTADGYHHLGDLTLRVRVGDSGPWQDGSTAAARRPVRALPATGETLAASDLTPTLPADLPVRVVRGWALDHNRLVLRFAITNTRAEPVQIGALGLPMIFNNILTDRTLEQAHETCSFFDPYIGQDAGYLQVTRLSGKGPALVVVPEGRTPFEAYRPLDEPTRSNQTFEGAFEWMAHSQAFAENEWCDADPWNPPTMATLAPGETKTYGVRFLVSGEIRDIEKTLAENGRPVAVGIPGYVLPMDLDGRLFLRYGHGVKQVTVEPAGAISFREDKPTPGGWKAYTLRGKKWGRARLTLTYDDDFRQSVSYYITKPAAQAVADLGRFLMTRQWFEDANDPFHRSPSVISYDRDADRPVTQDGRVWIAGLGDEAGSGSWLAAAMKQFGQPSKEELAKYERFVDGVLWGGIQYKDGPNRYGVRKSLFFYEPQAVPGFTYDPKINWGSWTSWSQGASEDVGRGYNYPHVVAAYWSLYRLARNHTGLVTDHPWEWYLDQAYQTVRFLTNRRADGSPRVGYVEWGLMDGTVFVKVLEDLKREGWTEKAADMEARMRTRADRWVRQEYPFGSEMAWDSTGQEEVYAWCKYFGFDEKAQVSLDAILGYMPTVPHWGYNGNARRYWDFLYGGKLTRIERQLHHYGSGLNALPVLAQYREHPNDFYLLRVGYGGMMGALTNIDRQGFASAAFHSFPSTLKWDAYSGDYGPNFFGHALNTATYVIRHPEFGWQSFGGNIRVDDHRVNVRPLDSFRQRVYVAPRGLWLTLEAGAFEAVEVDTRTHAVRVRLAPATPEMPLARLRVDQPAKVAGVGTYRPRVSLKNDRGAYTVPLKASATWIELTDGER